MRNTYRIVQSDSIGEVYKINGSRFTPYIFYVTSEEEIKGALLQVKEAHPKARHCCYAWRLGKEVYSIRANDDGEPTNSAGQPILGQIESFDVTNVLIVVVRYSNGTKLGVGGLKSSYKESALIGLSQATILEKTIDIDLKLKFNYDQLNTVMRIIKDFDLSIVSQKQEMYCEYILAVPKEKIEELQHVLDQKHQINFVLVKS